MTPKEKAEELMLKYVIYVRYYDDYEHIDDRTKIKAKECALIAVEQLIKYHDFFMDYVRVDLPSNLIAGIPYKYWDKVKKEIEAL